MRFARSARRWPTTLLLAALLLACGPSASFQRGSQAEQSGDWYTAVRSYRQALADDPDDEEARAGLVRAERGLVDQTVAAVDNALVAYDYETALNAIAPGLELLPSEPELLLRLDTIRTSALGYYEHRLIAGAHREAFERSNALWTAFPNDPEARALAERARTEYAAVIRGRAERAEAEAYAGLALALWSVHEALTGSSDSASHAEALRRTLGEQVAFRYHVRFEGLLRGWPAVTLPGALAELTTDEAEAQMGLRALLGSPAFQQTYQSGIATQDYIAGYRDVPNPAHQACLNDITQQQRWVLQAENDVLRAEEDAHRAMVERDRHAEQDDYSSYYNRWDAAERQSQRAREDLLRERQRLQDLRERLLSIPPTVEEAVWASYSYEVRDYTRTARTELVLEVRTPGAAPESRSYPLEVATHDTWHDIHPTIELFEDPLRYPVDEAGQTSEIQAQAAALATSRLAQGFEAYRSRIEAEGMQAAATHPDDAADLLGQAALLEPERLGEAAATWLDEYTGLVDPSWVR